MKKAPSYETAELREVERLIRGRRTIDQYLELPVPEALVLEAIDVARWAPNHHVTEPWHFYLLGPETVEGCLGLCEEIVTAKKGPEAGAFKRNAWSKKPGWVVMTCKRSPDNELLEREDYAACSAAMQNFMLYLWKAGVGTKWTTGPITRDPRLAEIVGFDPEKEFVVGLTWYGYPKLTPEQKRRDTDEILTQLP